VVELRKAILASLTILCSLLVPFTLLVPFIMECKVSVKASTTTWTVDDDGPADFHTIQEAINSASSGDRIFVRAGIYHEHVAVDKSLTLVGENRDSTIIDGNGTGSVISIKADSVCIESFTVNKSGTSASEYDSGIFVERSSGNNISHNTITNNYYGISLYSSIGNTVSDNTISNNYDGIRLYSSSIGNTVSDNTISNNEYGISLYSSIGNTVSDNTISNNDYGIILFDSSNNLVFHNNFINNTQQQAYSYNSVNLWDNGVEGNYWSNYTGVDLNNDGIGDTPHVIDTRNQDKNPLKGMYSDFIITSEGENYCVLIICNSTISGFRFETGLETGNKIIRFNATGKDDTVGFCRVGIPIELMNYPYILLIDAEEIAPTLLDISNETYSYLYFTYVHTTYTISIISSKTLYLYYELIDKYTKLKDDLYNLNETYHDLLNNYSILLDDYGQLQENYSELNNTYNDHLADYSKNVNNIRNLMYIFAASTAIFIITTIYLSKYAHTNKNKVFGDAQKKRTL